MHYHQLETGTPLGVLTLIASSQGLLRVVFNSEDPRQVLSALVRDPRLVSEPSPKENKQRLAVFSNQLTEYFAGHRFQFDLELDDRLSSGFLLKVQRRLAEIPYGETLTYAQLALRLENAKAVRAVGSGCARNPLPLIRPCHRVIRTDGGLGGFRGGVKAKRWLLDFEASTAGAR